MILVRNILVTILVVMVFSRCKNKQDKQKPISHVVMTDYYTEPYRPQFHFSPEENWMNDPNGMVFHKGVYHLFYQYYPEDIVWGPMHWGHATSKDLVHWEHKPIALFPDEHGLIFSGSAVVDFANTSGFGTLDNPPLVAIFTYHLMEGEKAGRDDFQTQGIAYSTDNGNTWTKFDGNPVIKNDGLKDFRDPKVFWDEKSHQWIMSVVAGDHLQLWGSSNLKEWAKLSEFGKDKGAHGGVWECPDLFPLKVEGSEEEKWVLLISINPGAPNGGSGTQYFIGEFDGEIFTTEQTETKWFDWGTDNYAGVTYNVLPQDYYGNTYANDPKQDRIFIGWMSNWTYARDTPTQKWRSAMTIPRKLSLKKISDAYELVNYPIQGIEALVASGVKKDIELQNGLEETIFFDDLNQSEIRFQTVARDFKVKLQNTLGEETVLTMIDEEKVFYLDRTNSGKVDFQEDFASIQEMPIPFLPEVYEVRILVDQSSVEVFINEGQYVMTAQIFPSERYTKLSFLNSSEAPITLNNFSLSSIQGTW